MWILEDDTVWQKKKSLTKKEDDTKINYFVKRKIFLICFYSLMYFNSNHATTVI